MAISGRLNASTYIIRPHLSALNITAIRAFCLESEINSLIRLNALMVIEIRFIVKFQWELNSFLLWI